MSAKYLDLASGLVATSLGAVAGEWHVDANYVRGPGKAAVIVAQSHGSATHLDFAFRSTIDGRTFRLSGTVPLASARPKQRRWSELCISGRLVPRLSSSSC